MDLVDSLRGLDTDVFRALNQAGSNDLLDSVMTLFTLMGIGYVIVLVSIPLWLKGKRDAAFDLVVIVIVVTMVTEALKMLVDRPRPFEELANVHKIISASGPSFPSAHASRAFAVALLVSVNTKKPWAVVAFIIATLIAVSRVFLGVHWPSDVLFGALLGVSLAATISHIERRCKSYRDFRGRILGLFNTLARRRHESRQSANDKAVET